MPFDYLEIQKRLDTLKEQGKLTEIQSDFLYKIYINSYYKTHSNNHIYLPEIIKKYYSK